MRILLINNFYQTSAPSGENLEFMADVKLLRDKGHEVITFVRHNDDMKAMPLWRLAMQYGMKTIWANDSYRELRRLIRKERPDVANFQNSFPQISPSAYYACRAEGVPSVQRLVNYRLFCANGLMARVGRVCEDCLKHGSIMGLVHGCYRNSRFFSAPIVVGQYLHQNIGTYEKIVTVFSAATEFVKAKYVEFGISPEKIFVKGNFAKIQTKPGDIGDSIVFIGNLYEMKGTDLLMKAFDALPDVHFHIIGSGPDEEKMRKLARKNVTMHGLLPRERAMEILRGARAFLMPSKWYEGLPLTIVEAFAMAKPVVASNLGAMSIVVEHGKTGLHFDMDKPEEMIAMLRKIVDDKPLAERMGKAARSRFELKYSPEAIYRRMMEIFEIAIAKGA